MVGNGRHLSNVAFFPSVIRNELGLAGSTEEDWQRGSVVLACEVSSTAQHGSRRTFLLCITAVCERVGTNGKPHLNLYLKFQGCVLKALFKTTHGICSIEVKYEVFKTLLIRA